MNRRSLSHIWSTVFTFALILQACSSQAPVATDTVVPTNTPQPPTATSTVTPTFTATARQFGILMPTRKPNLTATHNAQLYETSQAGKTGESTPLPTRTPNLAATQKIEERDAEVESYFDAGYLTTTEGKFVTFKDFEKEWAQLNWYRRYPLQITATNFYMSAHLKWSSAYRNADVSGCGFVFAQQNDGAHYGAFLDRSKVVFVQTDEYYHEMGPTRGTGRVDLGNPFDAPIEADLTLIVQDAYAYVLVNGEVIGEYTLSKSKPLKGTLGLSLMSGTNKDFGTHCEWTNIYAWLPED